VTGFLFLHIPATNARRRRSVVTAPWPHDRSTEIPAGVPRRLLMVYGPAAPDLLRRMADELEWLAETERERQANGCDKGLNG